MEVDGGIGPSDTAEVARAGAEVLVAGSTVFFGEDGSVAENVEALDRLGAWMGEATKLARVVLAGQRQKLEELGILARS